MNNQALAALITGGAGMLGALLGFVGSLLAGRRTARLSREQAYLAREQPRYERIHEMRAEVLSKLYGDLWELFDSFISLARRPTSEATLRQITNSYSGHTDQTFEELVERLEEEMAKAKFDNAPQLLEELQSVGEELKRLCDHQWAEVQLYLRRNALWIPDDAGRSIDALMDGFLERSGQYWKSLFEIALDLEKSANGASELERATERYNTCRTEFLNWLEGDATQLIGRVLYGFRNALGTQVEDETI